MVKLIINILLIATSISAQAQSLAERLGYSATDKLLIISIDEAGMCHATNEATIQVLQNQHIKSASIMIPCPWVYEMAQYSKRNKKNAYGVQLTLLSGWKNKYCWSTISNTDSVPSLVNEQGVMWSDIVDLFENGKTIDIKKELKAQIDRALELGIPVNYLNAHMSVLSYKQLYWEQYVAVAKEYNLPIRFISLPNFHGNDIEMRAKILDSLGIIHPDHILLNEIDSLHYSKQFPAGMQMIFENLKPGVTELFLQPAIYSPEIKALTPQYQRRVAEYGWLISDQLPALIEKYNIKIVSYKDLYNLQQSK